MLIIIIWVICSLIVGGIGSDRNIGFAGGFFLSLLLSPVIGLIIVIVSKVKTIQPKKTQPKKIIRCDGCREVINGDYIIIRPKGTSDKLDYCSEECRDTYYPKYENDKGIEPQIV